LNWVGSLALRSRSIGGLCKDVSSQARDVARIFSAPLVKTASTDNELHFYIDPRLAGKYKVNLHLMGENDKEDGRKMVEASDKSDNFSDETINFPSRNKSDPHYVCNVVFQKPEDKVFCVSAYLMETYLGRYAYKANWYFREKSRPAAVRCYGRVLVAVKDLRQDVIENGLNQSEIPFMMGRLLQGERGEVEPKINQMATYLNPDNVPPKTSLGSERIPYFPKHRGIAEELDLESQG